MSTDPWRYRDSFRTPNALRDDGAEKGDLDVARRPLHATCPSQEAVFGACVQLAARACGHAQPRQILAPALVRDLCIGKGFQFLDIGEVPLKGFDDPIRLFEVKW